MRWPAAGVRRLLPAVSLGQTGCADDANGSTDTRTSLAAAPVRPPLWNLRFHGPGGAHALPCVRLGRAGTGCAGRHCGRSRARRDGAS